jgi:DNA-binding transcriptional regulator YhcF (GntR family)
MHTARRLVHSMYSRFDVDCDLVHHSCDEAASIPHNSLEDLLTTRTGRHQVADELRDRIVTGLHVGRLRGSERLPPVRQLALEFGVNERVVLGALRLLADEGFVELRPRSGTYVAPPHPGGGDALPHLGAWIVTVLLQARTRGIAPRHVSDHIKRCLDTRHVRAACIECNLDQLHLLCSELADDHGYIAESAPLEELSAVHPPLAVTRADVLITTTFHADRVRRLAERLGKPWIAVALRPDIMRTVAQHLQQGPVYYVATDPRYERKLRRMLAPFGSTANLRVLLVDRDELDAIPGDAPTFVMTSAREYVRKHFRGGRGPGRPIHPARHFSDGAARELLAFMVRQNLAALTPRPPRMAALRAVVRQRSAKSLNPSSKLDSTEPPAERSR